MYTSDKEGLMEASYELQSLQLKYQVLDYFQKKLFKNKKKLITQVEIAIKV